jgi:hypothetical protein
LHFKKIQSKIATKIFKKVKNGKYGAVSSPLTQENVPTRGIQEQTENIKHDFQSSR